MTKFVGLVGAIWGTALSAMFPMYGLLSTYVWPSDHFEVYKLVAMSVFITWLGLLPAAAFYICKDKPWTRARNALGGVVMVVATALFFAPATVPAVVNRAAKMIGIQDLQVSAYMIKDTYATEDFDKRWGNVKTIRGYPVVEAFALFSLGDLLLLCPQSLAHTDLQDWPSEIPACIVLDGKTTKPMPDKQAEEKKR